MPGQRLGLLFSFYFKYNENNEVTTSTQIIPARIISTSILVFLHRARRQKLTTAKGIATKEKNKLHAMSQSRHLRYNAELFPPDK